MKISEEVLNQVHLSYDNFRNRIVLRLREDIQNCVFQTFRKSILEFFSEPPNEVSEFCTEIVSSTYSESHYSILKITSVALAIFVSQYQEVASFFSNAHLHIVDYSHQKMKKDSLPKFEVLNVHTSQNVDFLFAKLLYLLFEFNSAS